jgi:5-methylcytosine-specific restriction protein A
MSLGHIARPDLPRLNCRVNLVCGPPAAGKTTYVRDHAAAADIVIDVDAIAREQGFDRDRPQTRAGDFLRERNRRLAALADAPADHVAWIIIGAPSPTLRRWWAQMLNAENVILLVAPRDELRRRVLADPDRRYVCELHFALIDKWLKHERYDDPGIYRAGADVHGFPTDPLHPWNREEGNPNAS